MSKLDQKLRSGEELTKAEWDEVLWGVKPKRTKRHGRTYVRKADYKEPKDRDPL